MENQKVMIQKQNAPLVLQEEERLQRVTQKSDLIIIGTIVDLGPAPKDWSGYTSSYQTVRYKIEKIVKGQYGASEISVDHIVVFGSRTAQPGETPGLSDVVFSPGTKLIVSAQRYDSSKWKSLNEVIGGVPYSAGWLQKVEAYLPSSK